MATMLTQTKVTKGVIMRETGWNSRQVSCKTPANSKGEYQDTQIVLKVKKAEALAKIDTLIAAGFEVFLITYTHNGERKYGMPLVKVNRKLNGFITVCDVDMEWGSGQRYNKFTTFAQWLEYLKM